MTRAYEQICGLARGLDIIGERWSLLIARELLLGPKRFTDLLDGLPGIPPSLLSQRLKELQSTGIVSKAFLPPPAASSVYQLTDAGKALENILYALGRWGAQFGRKSRLSDAVRPEWILFALRSLFRPEAAAGAQASYELRLPEGVFHATVDDGVLTAGMGPGQTPQLVLTSDRPTIMAVLTGRLAAKDAVRQGKVQIQGERKLFERFVEMFTPAEALALSSNVSSAP